MNIAIVDAATHLVAFARMEDAKTTSTSIAMDKAFTAAGHRMTTRALSERAAPTGGLGREAGKGRGAVSL